MKVVCTKKIHSTQIQKLTDKGIEFWNKDFISIEFISFNKEEINNYKCVIITSKNAFYSILDNKGEAYLKHKKIFCVGIKTKEIIIKEGFQVIVQANDAKQLAQEIIKNHNQEKFLFLSGNWRSDIIPKMLTQNNIFYKEITVYRTKYTSYKIDFNFDAILFFSPSGVRSFMIYNTLENKQIYCIGKTTANALQNHSKKCIIAKESTVEGLIKEFIKYNKI